MLSPPSELCLFMERASFTALQETTVEHAYSLTDLFAYRHKTFSSLHLISDAAFARGLARMERDQQSSPIPYVSRYVLVWGREAASAQRGQAARNASA